MPTLRDFLSSDAPTFQTKTASEDSIDKLAAELGLWDGDSTKVAEFPPMKAEGKKKEEEEEEEEEEGHHKKASLQGIDGLYDSLFPDDMLGGVKTAAEMGLDKEAALQEALGASAHVTFQARFDDRMAKLAYAALSGGQVAGHDSEHPNHVPNDKGAKGNGGKPLDLSPEYSAELHPESSSAVVGKEEWSTGHNEIDSHMAKKAALARRKQFLLAQLEG